MKIDIYKDFRIYHILTRKNIDIFWAETGELDFPQFLDFQGNLVKADELLFQEVEFEAIEELEDALSLYYGLPIETSIPRTQKRIL